MQLRTTSGIALALLLAAMILPCFDFCPEDGDEESCPPVCASCLGCPRSSAIAPATGHQAFYAASIGLAATEFAGRALPILPDDIPHIPLASAA